MRSFIVLLSVCLGFFATADAQCTDACWEKCYMAGSIGEMSRYKQVYDEVLEIAMEINFLRNIYNISRIGWLIDSALSDHHNEAENTNTDQLQNGENIFKFELLLAMALSLTVNGQYNYLIQYDESNAWTCNEFSCMSSSCDTAAAINRLTMVHMQPTSHCPGNVEAACKLFNNQIVNLGSCTAPNQNSMAIAITNGDFYISNGERRSFRNRPDRVCPPYNWGGYSGSSSGSSGSSSSSSEETLYSPCHSYFETRYTVGTHEPSREIMEMFPSKHGNYRYIHDERFSYNALANLVSCMLASTACCPTAPTATVVTSCQITQGSYGNLINPYTSHSAFTATNNIFGATVGTITAI